MSNDGAPNTDAIMSNTDLEPRRGSTANAALRLSRYSQQDMEAWVEMMTSMARHRRRGTSHVQTEELEVFSRPRPSQVTTLSTRRVATGSGAGARPVQQRKQPLATDHL
ncbi:MAG: hypothetical protein Q9222_002203 [Ikaeria aurantiellina]